MECGDKKRYDSGGISSVFLVGFFMVSKEEKNLLLNVCSK